MYNIMFEKEIDIFFLYDFFFFNFTDDTSYSSVTISFVGIRKGKNIYHTFPIKNIYNI